MSETVKKQGWTVNKRHGYISEISWIDIESQPGVIRIYHWFDNSQTIHGNGDEIYTPQWDNEPYENPDAWIFTSIEAMNAWLKEECDLMAVRKSHYQQRIALSQAESQFMDESIWPANFIIGYLPGDYKTHTRIHIPSRSVMESSVEKVIQLAEQRIGVPLSKFSRVWVSSENKWHRHSAEIKLAVSAEELRELCKPNINSDKEVREQIAHLMSELYPLVEYNLNVYFVPAYIYSGTQIVPLQSSESTKKFCDALEKNIKSKLSSATRKSKQRANSSACAYLISKDIIHNVPVHIRNKAIVLRYASKTERSYAISSPIQINVWYRPDNTIVLDILLPMGSATLMEFSNTISSINILDQFVD